MSELLYTGFARDHLAQYALGMFKDLPTARIRALSDHEPSPYGSVMVFSSHGMFPSRYGRIVQPTDHERRQITTPTSAQYAKNSLALNKSAAELARQHPEHFLEALLNFHYILSGLPRPCSTRRSGKRDWWIKHQEARHEERRERILGNL